MVKIHTLEINPPLLNASCAWASDLKQLRELYDSPHTGAVTTRTATLNGYSEDASNKVAFTADTVTSINSFGYSPHSLTSYLGWVHTLLTTPTLSGGPPTKPIIVSITASAPTVLAEMLAKVQALRATLRAGAQPDAPDPAALLAVELNTSCPNIKDTPPAAYTFPFLLPFLDVLAAAFYADPTLTLGLKLPPYLYSTRFSEVVRCLHTYTRELRPASRGRTENGMFSPRAGPPAKTRATPSPSSPARTPSAHDPPQHPRRRRLRRRRRRHGRPPARTTSPPAPPSPSAPDAPFALPPALGGLGGEAVHAVALGNVYSFARLLAAHPDAAIRRIRIIGVGGVTTPAAATRMRAAGASVVGCATLLGREGVRAFEILSQAA
ncbi:Dihydroorotate dehydrogenase (fumarate) [Grifola frondosa]|uniref:Dihydroorotate dehydrogenase (Fumarate) n=1 Tax=Grifola frondosa TaxID=5627 RepID=A0A1C7MSK2_GRIFR|nr:Dihydroorotate dehydrogenase (fumarate) [Grifola frondosa]